MTKIKVTAVSYLNTKPLLYGLLQDDIEQWIDLQLDIPAVCANKLLDGRAQLGLVPVATIPQLPEWHLISDYCIGSDGPVRTVAIYSDCPLEEVEELLLDPHSRTSVQLVRVLLQDFWKLSPKLVPAQEGFISRISGKRAALVIGDRAIGLETKHPHHYDLGEVWKRHTGLPFVFAAWVSTAPLSSEFLERFNNALANGIASIPKLVYLLPRPQPQFDLEEYFSTHISYQLDNGKKKALDLFLSLIRPEKMVEHP